MVYSYDTILCRYSKIIACSLFYFLMTTAAKGQSISRFIPVNPDKSARYLFYLHGGIVQDEGIHAVSPDWGKYEYEAILDTLRNYGFNVLSEPRAKGTDDEEYGIFIYRQVDTLLKLGISPEHITVVGASQGASMTIVAAYKLRNSKIKYAVLGLCEPFMIDYYAKYKDSLCGNFLSIYERSDPHGSCDKLFMEQYCKTGYKEIELNMGISHGFIFRPYPEWVHPLIKWIKEKN